MAFGVTEVDSFKSSTSGQASYTSPTFSPAAGDIIVVVVGTNLNQAPSSVVDSLSNAYTQQLVGSSLTTTDGSLYTFKYTGAQSNITVAVNWSPSVGERLVKVLKVTGGGTPPDTASAGGTGGNALIRTATSGTSHAAGTMTPTTACLIIAGDTWSNSTAASSGPSGYTNTGTDLNEATRGRSLSTYYKVQSVTGAENPTWTLGAGGAGVTMQIGIPGGVVQTNMTLTATAIVAAAAVPKQVNVTLVA